ncbi:DUF4335 domain-containing protein [Vulcanococcus sp.]|uniref:DUF4335 domain-containing protein n=1 Tax=Vulcanococcus sp. TaxID=2856995 RepID=UPI003F6A1DC4
MKLTSRYEQTSCRLVLEGLPDLSAGQSSQTIGILTGFTLALAGKTEMEGQRDHLQALVNAVLPYARQLLSGVSKPVGSETVPVAIRPADGGHELELRSSQPNTPPLQLPLDDAELSDLVRCLDRLQLDPAVVVPLQWPQPQPLRRSELRHRLPLARRIAAPLTGVAALLISAALISLVPPTPRPPSTPVSAPASGG